MVEQLKLVCTSHVRDAGGPRAEHALAVVSMACEGFWDVLGELFGGRVVIAVRAKNMLVLTFVSCEEPEHLRLKVVVWKRIDIVAKCQNMNIGA